jgi:hypothetical protein
MGEGDILIDHIPLEVFDLVATLLETARITDLCVGRTRPFSGKKIGQRYLTIHPLPPQMIIQSRFIMAFRAGHMSMAGCSPRFHIGIHLVTEAAKGRTFREFKKGQRENKECDDAKDKRSLYCPGVIPSSFFKTQENIIPKSFD